MKKKNNKIEKTNKKKEKKNLLHDTNEKTDYNIYDKNNLEIEFLVDKYIPSNVSDIIDPVYEHYYNLTGKNNTDWKYQSPSKCYFHKQILEKLKIISSDDCMPHIIFYGNPGTGKKTLINLFLEMIFHPMIYICFIMNFYDIFKL